MSYGGLLSYSHSSGASPLPFPRAAGLRVLLINTRVSRNTRAMVEKVRAMLGRQPKLTGRILEAMDQVKSFFLFCIKLMFYRIVKTIIFGKVLMGVKKLSFTIKILIFSDLNCLFYIFIGVSGCSGFDEEPSIAGGQNLNF